MQDGGKEGLIRHLVLDGAAMDFMDATGLEVLQAVLLKPPAGLRVVLADPSHDLLDLLKRGGVLQHLGEALISPVWVRRRDMTCSDLLCTEEPTLQQRKCPPGPPQARGRPAAPG